MGNCETDATATQLMANAKDALRSQGLKVIDFDFTKVAADLCTKPVKTKNKDSFSESVGAANTIAELTGPDA